MAMARQAHQSLREAAVGDYVMVRHRGEKEYQERLITFKSSLDDRVTVLTLMKITTPLSPRAGSMRSIQKGAAAASPAR